MRIGNNPLRQKHVEEYGDIVLAVITHLPDMSEKYHAQRLEVIQICLRSMRSGAGGLKHRVLVWDNGSCGVLKSWLQDVYKPDILVQSFNVGKSSARTGIFNLFPAKVIVAICDDDMLFYPYWLRESLAVFHAYPNVGAVSCYPVRTQFRWGNLATLKWAEKNHIETRRGKLISEQWDRDFCTSIGRDWKFQQQYTKNDEDVLLKHNGVYAYATGHHCQFLAEAGRIRHLLEWNNEAMSDEHRLDNVIDGAGMLRLTTQQRYARHMGNVLDDELREEARKIGALEVQ